MKAQQINIYFTGNPTSRPEWNYCATYDDYDGAPDARHHCRALGTTIKEAVTNLLNCECE